MNLFVGIDPGGKNAFGWCLLARYEDGSCAVLSQGTASSAQQALSYVFSVCPEAPVAAGIDAPLYWSSREERQSDRRIRRAVLEAGGHSATVAHINSLRGACLVQGVLAAAGLGKRWPNTRVTESHPKALLHVWPKASEFLRLRSTASGSEHERDALLGAYSALQYESQCSGWKDWVLEEDEPYFPSGNKVAYWFPEVT